MWFRFHGIILCTLLHNEHWTCWKLAYSDALNQLHLDNNLNFHTKKIWWEAIKFTSKIERNKITHHLFKYFESVQIVAYFHVIIIFSRNWQCLHRAFLCVFYAKHLSKWYLLSSKWIVFSEFWATWNIVLFL